MKLAKQWKERLKLRAEGYKLCAEGHKLCAEGEKLWAEGSKLRAEGDKLWAEAIFDAYGNIKMLWEKRDGKYDCHLENGDIYVEE